MNGTQLSLAAFAPQALVALACQSPAAQHVSLETQAPLELDTALLPSLVVRGEPLPPAAERSLRKRMAESQVPGLSVAVIRDGELEWAAGFGFADVDDQRPVTPRTLFQAASISKPVAAMGALRLVQEGVLELDADVNLALESWQVSRNEFTHPAGGSPRPVTLRDLLSHTAGLTVHGFPGYARDQPVPTTVDVLEGQGNTPPVRVDMTPGSARRYSGGGYTVAQLLMVEAAGGERDFAKLMQASVLRPLGMRDSTFEQPLPEALHARAATGYLEDGAAVEGLWHVYPEQAAAGLWTTPSDLARFALAIQRGAAGDDGPVLEARWIEEMRTAPVEEGYGLGLSLGAERFGHGGGNFGFRCSLTAFFEGGNGAVVMTNSDNGWNLGSEVMRTLFDHYGWPGLKPVEKQVVELGRERLEGYAGTYRFEGYGDARFELVEPGDRLRFLLPDGDSGHLRPESETTFFVYEDGRQIEFFFDEASGAVAGFRWSGFEATRVE